MTRREPQAGRLARASICLVFVMALFVGCSARARQSRDGAAETETSRGPISASDRVLVIPFRDGSCLPAYGNHVTCHLTGEDFGAGDVPKGTGAELAAILSRDLQARGAPVIPFEQGVDLLAQTDPALVDRYEPALAIDLGKRASASKVIMGVVMRYEERSGSWFGSRDPAAVAFSLAFVDVATGTITQTLRFNRQQAPLTSNLLAFVAWWQQGFKWWTREEVAEQALAEAADVFVGAEGASLLWTTRRLHPRTNATLRPAAHEEGEWQMEPAPTH